MSMANWSAAWLMQIAVNCARMKARREGAGHGAESLDEIFGDDGVSSPPRQIVDLRHSPSVYFERKEIYETLKRALERLPLIYREVFLLREIRQLSVNEPALLLDITIPTVKSTLYRAKLRLRQFLLPLWRTT